MKIQLQLGKKTFHKVTRYAKIRMTVIANEYATTNVNSRENHVNGGEIHIMQIIQINCEGREKYWIIIEGEEFIRKIHTENSYEEFIRRIFHNFFSSIHSIVNFCFSTQNSKSLSEEDSLSLDVGVITHHPTKIIKRGQEEGSCEKNFH